MRKNSYTSRVRNKVLSASLRLDKVVTLLLGDWLELNTKTSLTLGNKSTTLAFKSKIELLIDIGVLQNTSKGKFLKFMEIRNQFAHNISVESFTTCFENIDGLTAFLKKNYPDAKSEKKSKESLLEKLFDELSSDVFSLVLIANKTVREKKRKRLSALYKNEAFEVLTFSVENMAKIYLSNSETDSPANVLAKRMIDFVKSAKDSLYENVVKDVSSEHDEESPTRPSFPIVKI